MNPRLHLLVVLIADWSFALPTGIWVVNTSHRKVTLDETKNVSVTCFFDKTNYKTELFTYSGVEQLQLTLRPNRTARGIRMAVISMKYAGQARTPGSDNPCKMFYSCAASGKMNEKYPKKSWLSLSWTTAALSTEGWWSCQITTRISKTQTKVIDTRPTSQAFIIMNKSRIKNKYDELIQLEHHIKIFKDVYYDLRNRYRFFDQRYWPNGPFAILRADKKAQCPHLAPTKTGQMNTTVNIYSAVIKPYYADHASYLADNDHMFYRIGDVSNVALHYCMVNNQTKNRQNIEWPRGSYCVNGIPACPKGFQPSKMFVQLRESFTDHMSSSNIPAEENHTPVIYFCCRNDGDAFTKMYLPSVSSFFLYRLGGTCQSIYNMNDNVEYIRLGTQTNYHDKIIGNPHPDVKVDPARLAMCYYKPRVAFLTKNGLE